MTTKYVLIEYREEDLISEAGFEPDEDGSGLMNFLLNEFENHGIPATLFDLDHDPRHVSIVDPTEAMIDAPRSLLLAGEAGIQSVGETRRHIERCGDSTACWPGWAKTEDKVHLTKAGRAILVWAMMSAAAPKGKA